MSTCTYVYRGIISIYVNILLTHTYIPYVNPSVLWLAPFESYLKIRLVPKKNGWRSRSAGFCN